LFVRRRYRSGATPAEDDAVGFATLDGNLDGRQVEPTAKRAGQDDLDLKDEEFDPSW
jgi:hypothetical protein